jgi:hypothetical protein
MSKTYFSIQINLDLPGRANTANKRCTHFNLWTNITFIFNPHTLCYGPTALSRYISRADRNKILALVRFRLPNAWASGYTNTQQIMVRVQNHFSTTSDRGRARQRWWCENLNGLHVLLKCGYTHWAIPRHSHSRRVFDVHLLHLKWYKSTDTFCTHMRHRLISVYPCQLAGLTACMRNKHSYIQYLFPWWLLKNFAHNSFISYTI